MHNTESGHLENVLAMRIWVAVPRGGNATLRAQKHLLGSFFMRPLVHRCLLLAFVAILGVGCASKTGRTTIQVVATPLTVVRDVVDAPLFTVTNCFEFFARNSAISKAPGANVGWSWQGGFNFGVGYNISYFLFKGLSGVFGGVDYIICRSLYPNWPNGVSPWTKKGDSWGKYYFPNTKALWTWEGEEEIETEYEYQPPPPTGQPAGPVASPWLTPIPGAPASV
ncbi:MAG: hypothetical protein PWP23_2786 [Candidatus Sumerlaeota bacterium]|nr:hypothetical protein [Candidatus Sumerlaeota bacterium]